MPDLVETPVGFVSEKMASKWQLVCHYMQPIMQYYLDPDVSEIMINRFDQIFIENRQGLSHTDSVFDSENHLEKLIMQLTVALQQDTDKPTVIDARFPDQSRACCTTTLVSPMGCTMTIRCSPQVTLSFDDLVRYQALDNDMLKFIKESVLAKRNIIISGSSGSGKTTLIRALAQFIPRYERVLICEDTQELFLDLPNQIPMESPKRKDIDITLSDLIKTTLRQRPDRVFVGEIRDAFACDAFLQVINTGHGGCVTSIHANSPKDAIRRMQYLLTKEGLIGYELAGLEIMNSVHVFIQTEKTPNGKKITSIAKIENAQEIKILFVYDPEKNIYLKNR